MCDERKTILELVSMYMDGISFVSPLAWADDISRYLNGNIDFKKFGFNSHVVQLVPALIV